MPVDRDSEGYLVDPDDWNKEIAGQFASEENIELDAESWKVIAFIRDYYAENHKIADVRHVVGHLVKGGDYDKKQAKETIFKLFPHGYVKQACKIAGMRRPRAWSTG